ncbi:STY0301 family protein [Paracidovorax oryzae]|uniref:STY0301 family protein n=1 Tax=Paracidovorax oryzae TaxID=862720 RepID=UPI000A079A60|nr:STY0301 family protein [Paracidovorax oryzae]
MSLSKQIAAFLLCLPSDLATLEPDVAKERYGHWVLGYIYDKGRFATIRCKYADKQTHDVKLAKRVEQCSYSINAKNVLRVTCK